MDRRRSGFHAGDCTCPPPFTSSHADGTRGSANPEPSSRASPPSPSSPDNSNSTGATHASARDRHSVRRQRPVHERRYQPRRTTRRDGPSASSGPSRAEDWPCRASYKPWPGWRTMRYAPPLVTFIQVLSGLTARPLRLASRNRRRRHHRRRMSCSITLYVPPPPCETRERAIRLTWARTVSGTYRGPTDAGEYAGQGVMPQGNRLSVSRAGTETAQRGFASSRPLHWRGIA